MNISPFTLCTNKKLIFKPGSIEYIATELKFYGDNTVIITGGKSLSAGGKLEKIEKSLKDCGISFSLFQVSDEPSPELIDEITEQLRGRAIDSIAAIGGGSVIDTGKAVSAMLREEGSICDFLEGIGTRTTSGDKLPFIAVPTTAGTGSEATYNAVISRVGENGFKKSLRNQNYVPEIAIIDPELYAGAPASVAASSGMDALAQLIESYLSTKSTFYTDLMLPGAIEAVFEALPIVTADKDDEEICDEVCSDAWEKMAYGAYISGLALANCGYCIVHGMAGAVGGFYKAPHGVICGALLAEGMKQTLNRLEKEDPDSPALLKAAKLGHIFAKSEDMLPKEARARFIQMLESLTESLGIPKLSKFGINEDSLQKIADASSNKNSPAVFEKNEIIEILRNRL
ncbi:MAG: iron-containing alcohol dehydrogenase [Spirochaetales bacterium]|uniref:Iron-containing alcohol dehydrogenase n=1 Tax=Candidatus Thalassospirochaeta sargassi TaxID=3119039 RepID=A0AAJ1IIM8_9SPIO|nr:iron-containing alcohol dehydrogenase [Spirochaetales bacterium]